MENSRIFAYVRVSTTDQDVANQKHGVLEYANQKGLTNITFIEDNVSSRVDWQDRKIGKLIHDMREGDTLLCSEVTRLGRSPLEVLEMQREIITKKCVLHIVKENLIIGTSGKTEIEILQQEFMLIFLGMVGKMERAFISTRTKESLARLKAEGVKLGRPSRPQLKVKLDSRRAELEKLLEKGIPITNISKILDVSTETIYQYIRKRNIKYNFRDMKKKPAHNIA